MKTKLFGILGVLMVLGLLAAQCGPAPTPQTIVQTVEVVKEVEKQVEVIKTVEVEKEVKVIETVEVEVIKEVQPEAKPQGTLTVALTTFPNSLDVATTAERNAENAAWQLYDSLIWIDDEGNKVPALAESWEVSDDGTEYTFHLRQDVTFHNGEPFTADAVVFSWERGSQPGMEWADRWGRAESVEKVDDYTVKITTAEPDPLFLAILAEHWGMVPPQYIAEVGDEGFNEHPVGTGPFMFVEWVKGDRIEYQANPNYWDTGRPKVETLIFRSIPESSTRAAAIQTGEVDVVTRLSSEEAKTLLGLPNVRVLRYPVDRAFYITFNNLTTGVGQPTEDVQVRQAMNHAVDRQAIIDQLFDGYGRLSTGLITPVDLGHDGTLEPYAYDPDRARELLAEAGFADGFDIDFACPAGAYTNFEEVCEAIVGYLAEVGINANLEIMESGQFWDLEAAKQLPPLFGDSWSERSGEALPRLIGALGGQEAAYSAWSEPTIDELLAEIGRTVDDEQRAALYGELQAYMLENPPFIHLYVPETFEALGVHVQDYKPRGAEDYFLKDTWVVEE
jgi:peptide/nickel transport system substrate-binding protein